MKKNIVCYLKFNGSKTGLLNPDTYASCIERLTSPNILEMLKIFENLNVNLKKN